MSEEKLNRATVRILRKVQKFLIEEPRRFDMTEGIKPTTLSDKLNLLKQPPCGTVCCIAGAAYAIDKKIVLNFTNIFFGDIEDHMEYKFKMTKRQRNLLFYVKGLHHGVTPGENAWPQFYTAMYHAAKTPFERACAGVARIEHFIATNGRE